MSFATDLATETADLLQTDVYGEEVTIFRNTPTYGDTGALVDSFAQVGDATTAEIQNEDQLDMDLTTDEIGQAKVSSYRIFFPNAQNLRQGDRIRLADWTAGDDEYQVYAVLGDEGHTEALATLVRGSPVTTVVRQTRGMIFGLWGWLIPRTKNGS